VSAASVIARYSRPLTITRPTAVVGSSGGISELYAPIGEVRGFVQKASGSRSEQYGGQRNSINYKVFLPFGSDILPEDRIEYLSGPSKRVLRVTGAVNPGEVGVGPLSRMEVDCYEELPRG